VKLDLSLIDKEPLAFDERLTLPAERLDEDEVVGEMSVHLVGTARSVGGRYVVSGSISAAGVLACTRCLEPVPWTLQDEFTAAYRDGSDAPGEGDFPIAGDELDVSFLTGSELDLAELAAEQVMLGMPMRIVCDESCAGLCPRCGANRNREGACRCEAEADPRWQALRDLAGRSGSN
jgi:uncharacterized protein